METKLVDHLFRHQYGKMVASLTRIFGTSYLETIEDAVQDTFVKASLQWRKQQPDNPKAWLVKAAKNRIIDIIRQIDSEKKRQHYISAGTDSIQIHELFLEHEVEDSQLRMIFVACHPDLVISDQVAFSLKTISGFSTREIAAALLQKEETIKKRLSRARQFIVKNNIKFEFPEADQVHKRLSRVMEVIYLTFNEGFHSTNKMNLIREDLCGEAIRLCKLLLNKEKFRSGSLYALLALMCFHSSRLKSKIDSSGKIIDLKHQDRSKWYKPLIVVGNIAMNNSLEYSDFSIYHLEAAIAAEHLKAKSFENTNWNKIGDYYLRLIDIQPSVSAYMNLSIVYLQLNKLDKAKKILDSISPENLGQRAYLYHGCWAEYYSKSGDHDKAVSYINKSIQSVTNQLEKIYLKKKKAELLHST